MSKEKDTSKLWGGRFSEATDAFVQRFTASVTFDQRMAAEDIAGSLAHARMLHSVGVLSARELAEIEGGLAQVQQEIKRMHKLEQQLKPRLIQMFLRTQTILNLME